MKDENITKLLDSYKKPIEAKIKSKLECLIELHNDVIRELAIYEADADYFAYLILGNPGNKDWYNKKIGAQENIKNKTKLLEILLKHIEQELAINKDNGKGN